MTEHSIIPWIQRPRWPLSRHSLSSLQGSIDSLFNEFTQQLTSWPSLGPSNGVDYMPRVDFCEEDDRYLLTAELPGVDKKDISISANGSSLTIKGEKRDEQHDEGETNGRHFYRHERSFGRFLRALPIPDDADAEKIAASFRDGVLTVEIPRNDKAKDDSRDIVIGD